VKALVEEPMWERFIWKVRYGVVDVWQCMAICYVSGGTDNPDGPPCSVFAMTNANNCYIGSVLNLKGGIGVPGGKHDVHFDSGALLLHPYT
jgi:hypothetical protein